MENARFQSRPLNLVAKVRSRGLDGSTQIGYVERTGLARIKRKDGKVEVFFLENRGSALKKPKRGPNSHILGKSLTRSSNKVGYLRSPFHFLRR